MTHCKHTAVRATRRPVYLNHLYLQGLCETHVMDCLYRIYKAFAYVFVGWLVGWYIYVSPWKSGTPPSSNYLSPGPLARVNIPSIQLLFPFFCRWSRCCLFGSFEKGVYPCQRKQIRAAPQTKNNSGWKLIIQLLSTRSLAVWRNAFCHHASPAALLRINMQRALCSFVVR